MGSGENPCNGFSPTLPTSPSSSEPQSLGCCKLVAQAKTLFCIDGLPLSGDFPLPVAHVVGIAHRDVSALFQPVRDDAAVAAILEPVRKFALGHAGDAAQRHGIRVAEHVEYVGQFGFFR